MHMLILPPITNPITVSQSFWGWYNSNKQSKGPNKRVALHDALVDVSRW